MQTPTVRRGSCVRLLSVTNARMMHIPGYSRFAAAASLLVVPLLPVSASPLSSCYKNSTTLDWYIDAVGETPCMTYQKLRQICNSSYQTPSWTIGRPADTCDDPLNICCCNSIAWSVRNLCINCEWDADGTTDTGNSGVPGDFYRWRWSTGVANEGIYCGDGWNQTLPDSVQLAVCQQGIRLENFLYGIFWPDGSWNFTDFEQQAQQILASQSQSLSYCQNTTQNVTIVTWSSAHTVDTQSVLPAAATSADNDAPVGGKTDTTVAAVGGALGGALGLLALGVIVAMLLYRRRLRRSSAVSMADSHDLSQNAHTSILTTFVGRNDSVLQSEHTSNPVQTPPPREGSSGLHSTSLVLEHGDEEYGNPVSITPSPYGGMHGSELPVRERDAGPVPVSDSLPELPPDYRTVYSDS
ncbi:hypothetical protein C8Q72DRAFT_328663 [Fomitopsis betulina]|nr:hypothetical protein C8Q72DRAFT_328663 [Fomitopsis betulina]